MSALKNGGPAFPLDVGVARAFAVFEHAKKPLCDEDYVKLADQLQAGMTLRDYFAAKAMQALISANIPVRQASELGNDVLPRHAYEIADAMLEARK